MTSSLCTYQAGPPQTRGGRLSVARKTPPLGGALAHICRAGHACCCTPSPPAGAPCRQPCSAGTSRPSASVRRSGCPGTAHTPWAGPVCSGSALPCRGDTARMPAPAGSRGQGSGKWGAAGGWRPRQRRWQVAVRQRETSQWVGASGCRLWQRLPSLEPRICMGTQVGYKQS